MQAIGFDFSIHNPIVMYSFLADAAMDLLMLAFVHSKVRRAVRGPKTLRIERDSVKSRTGVTDKVQEMISKVATRVLPAGYRVLSPGCTVKTLSGRRTTFDQSESRDRAACRKASWRFCQG